MQRPLWTEISMLTMASIQPQTPKRQQICFVAQSMLATANLRLHKIASSHAEVMEAFAPEDHASGLHNLDCSKGPIPIQRSLDVFWDLESDAFTFQVSLEEKPFSRRGVLSVTNSLYDPLGLAAPDIIKGKQLLRSMTSGLNAPHSDMWDTPLPEEYKPAWDDWSVVDSVKQTSAMKNVIPSSCQIRVTSRH